VVGGVFETDISLERDWTIRTEDPIEFVVNEQEHVGTVVAVVMEQVRAEGMLRSSK